MRLQGSDFSESSGELFGVTFTGPLEIEPTIDAVMVNVAIRNNSRKFHPYFGLGIGFGNADADLTTSTTLSVRGTTFATVSGSATDDDTAFAGQLFVGADADVGENWYVGINGRYFLMDADLFGADVEFRTWSVMGIVGFRF